MKRKFSSGAIQGAAKKPRYQRQNASPNLAMAIRRLDTTEKKNIDFASAATVVAAATTSVQFLLNGCAQGDTPAQRTGRRTTMTALDYRWVGHVAATTVGSSPLRMLIVYDRQPNKLAPAITDVVALDSISTMMNLSNS